MNYEQFDIFLITKDNWRNQKNIFYGYKTVGDEGFWLDLVNDGKKLKITGSIVQPPLAIYSKNNFWIISNNVKYLVNYLHNNNYPLTENSKFFMDSILNYGEVARGYCPNGYPETLTQWDEIRLTPNFSYLEIIDDEIKINKIEFPLHKLNLLDHKSLVENWFMKYKNYLKSLSEENKRINVQISGGVDSRFLSNFWKDIDITRITSNWKKEQERQEKGMDGLIARLAIAYFTKHKDKVDVKIPTSKIYKKNDLAESDRDLFWFGLSVDQQAQPSSLITVLDNNDPIRYYTVSGVGTEWFKGETSNKYQFIIGTARRYFLPKFIANYYFNKDKSILPYLDSQFLQLNGYSDITGMLFLYLYFSPQMLNYPFFSYGDVRWVPEETKNRIMEKIKNWK